MDEKFISVICPNCKSPVELATSTLMTRFSPKCRACRRGITIDRAWMIAEIARLQAELRLLGAAVPRVAKPGAAGDL